MAGPAGAHGGGHPDHGGGGSATEGSAGTGAESAVGGAALGPDAPAFGGFDPGDVAGGPGTGEAMSIEAFEAAIAKALGHVSAQLDDDPWGETESEKTMSQLDAMMDARERERERQAMMTGASPDAAPVGPESIEGVTADSVRSNMEAMGMFDDPSNTDPVSPDSNPVGPTRSFQEQAMNEAVAIGAQRTNPGATNTDPIAPSAHPSRDPSIGSISREQQEKEMDASYFDNLTPWESGWRSKHPSRDPRIGYTKAIETIDRMPKEQRALIFDRLEKLQKEAMEKTTPLGRALNTIFGGLLNNTSIGMLGKALKGILGKAGFNVNPDLVEQAVRQAHEITTQGPLGAGGTSVGARNDAFIEEILNNLPASAYDEPWMKGLTERQIQYYLDRPEELKWVRNLWNQMNPMNPLFVSPTN